jgi:hypothetical protein
VSVSETLRQQRRQMRVREERDPGPGSEPHILYRDVYAENSYRDKVYRSIENQIERMENLLGDLLREAGNDEAKRERILAVIQRQYIET